MTEADPVRDAVVAVAMVDHDGRLVSADDAEERAVPDQADLAEPGAVER